MVDVEADGGIRLGSPADQSIDLRPPAPGPGDLPRLIESSLAAPNPNAPAIEREMLDFRPCCLCGSTEGKSPCRGAGEGDLLPLPILRENEKLLRREDEPGPRAWCDDCERRDGAGETERWDPSDESGTVPTGCGRGEEREADDRLGIPSDCVSNPPFRA